MWQTPEGEEATTRTNWTLSYRDNVDAGTATVTAVGSGNYAGTVSATFRVTPYDLESHDVTFDINPTYYAGVALTPKPTVSVLLREGDEEEHVMELGTEYDLAYSLAGGEPQRSITAAGNYSVVVTGRGNFRGTYTGNVTVGKASAGGGGGGTGRSKVPMYRLYNPNSGEHFYTGGEVERNALRAVGWNFEGIGWYSDDARGVPLYRQYNPNAVTGSHNYTPDRAENDALVRMGWIAEGIGWYGVR